MALTNASPYNQGMKTRNTIIAAIACAALLFSCGPFGSRAARLENLKKEEAKGLLEKAKGFAALAAEMGWLKPKPKAVEGYLKNSDEGLGFKIVTSKDGRSMKTTVVWSAAARDKLLAEAAKKGYAASFEPVWHCRPYLDRSSPLPSAALQWNDAQLAEWLAWEWAAQAWKPKSDSDKAFSAASYVSYKAGQALLIKSLGSGSQVLAQWQESVWDRRTFQTLAIDLKGQVEGIITVNGAPEDRETVLKRIVGLWVKDYRANYSRRFITNAYVDFGKGDWVEPTALACMSWGSLGWVDWEKAFPGPVEDFDLLLKAVRK
jgi:hypothetical protein